MMKKRKIAMVANQVKMDEEDSRDVSYWLKQPASARLAEVVRLRREYHLRVDGVFPDRIEKKVSRRKL